VPLLIEELSVARYVYLPVSWSRQDEESAFAIGPATMLCNAFCNCREAIATLTLSSLPTLSTRTFIEKSKNPLLLLLFLFETLITVP
jgi:hypothetical protein